MARPAWLVAALDRAKRLWRTENPRLQLLRDIVLMVGIVGFLVAGVWVYSGQSISRAPVVSVESGSMMHGPHLGGGMAPTAYGDPPFGRIGTIDPGDVVVVKRVSRPEDISPAFGNGSKRTYGGPGDVIVYERNGDPRQPRVIHRAMLFVRAEPEGCLIQSECVFQIPAACNPEFAAWAGTGNLTRYCQGSNGTFDLHLRRDGVSLDVESYPMCTGCTRFYSSFITKGDNNPSIDQPGISKPVRMEWILGKARGELPWVGMLKLALVGNCGQGKSYVPATDPTRGSNWKILGGCAPWDVWTPLILTMVLAFAGPPLIERFVRHRASRRDGPQR